MVRISFNLYTYNAGGEKLRTDYYINPLPNMVPQVNGGTGMNRNANLQHTRVDYCGNLVYENDTLRQVLIDGGYVTFNGSSPQYHFYVQDHLGNNRVVCNASGTIEQVNHYYPYGGLFGESTNDEVQRYKYNGKELDRMHGLNLYDYHARLHDAALGQFTSMDQLCEKYYHISPYAYCAGNPVNAIDPDGREVQPDSSSFEIILNTLSREEQSYVSLNENGFIDSSKLSLCQSNSNNFQALQSLVDSPFLIEVTSLSSTEYIKEGKRYTEFFNQVEIIDDYKDPDFSFCSGNTTGETGNLGVTYLPTNGGPDKGPINKNNIHININPSLTPIGAAETFSHEGYGHALIYVRTNGNRYEATHHYLTGCKEGNQLLIDYIIRARKETVNNMMSR